MRRSSKALLAIACVIVLAGAAVGLAFTIPSAQAKQPVVPTTVPAQPTVQLDVTVVPEFMTALYKIYGGGFGDTWLARCTIKNTGEVPVKNLHISYAIPGYLDETSPEDYPLILPGQTVRDYCWPNFSPDLMAKINNKTPAELLVHYQFDGADRAREESAKFTFLGKNDFVRTSLPEDSWITFSDVNDNANMLAAFVTQKDPTIQAAAKKLTGGLATYTDKDAMSALEYVYNGIRDAGFRYVSEPSTYWTQNIGQHIQFPIDTINNEGGNCVDLSLLFSAMLEAVGVKTYLTLSTGHCQFAVVMPESKDIIPVEETMVDNPDSTLTDAIDSAYKWYQKESANGTFLWIDVEQAWQDGMVPSW
jgi:hypothetical protein